MQYISVKDASERWGVSMRRVQMYCNDGVIDGAVRFNRSWMIPITAKKPNSMQKTSKKYIATPLLWATTYFTPGKAEEALKNLSENERKQLEFEFYYFRGELSKSIKAMDVTNQNSPTRICALVISAFSAISLGDTNTYEKIRQQLLRIERTNEDNQQVLDTLELSKASLALAMYAPNVCPKMIKNKEFDTLPIELRRFALFLYCKYLNNQGKQECLYDLAYTALLLTPYDGYCLLDVYFHLICASACNATNKIELGKEHIKKALSLGLADEFIMPFTGHLILMKGFLEPCIKEFAPDYEKQILSIWHAIWKNWIYMHNHYSKENITLILNTREYQIADMACHGLSNAEIADKMNLSVSSIKSILQVIYEKLYINKRVDLKKYIIHY